MEINVLANWYVLQVITRKEQKAFDYIERLGLKKLKAFIPKKKLKIKKNGIFSDEVTPLYPGYIFIIGMWDLIEAKVILSVSNVVKFIGGINSPGMLQQEEKELILKITKDGITGYSKVINEGNKIKVISGALKELEGVIIAVDRRKLRATVQLPLLNSIIKASLGFEFIEVKDI